VRFLYVVTLGRETVDLMASVPHMKRATRRAEVYARSEVEAILTAPRQPRDRALLMTIYACGLRISEATELKTGDIDRARMQLRVRKGKGAALLRKPALSALPGRQKLAMARKADTQSLTDQLLPLRLHSAS
jgi:site-specific recombinase XerD